MLSCIEFRYDGDRQRYLVRERDPYDWDVILAESWHDYLGDQIWSDYTVAPNGEGAPVATTAANYVSGLGLVNMTTAPGEKEEATRYFHADMLGSTRLLTDEGGSIISGAGPADLTYAAFGRRLPFATPGEYPTPPTPVGIRYGFAGAHGYQDDALAGSGPQDWRAAGLLHLGARYYHPDLGRFVMRDPIGIRGGGNVYVYGGNAPPWIVDPTGRDFSYVSLAGAAGIGAFLGGVTSGVQTGPAGLTWSWSAAGWGALGGAIAGGAGFVGPAFGAAGKFWGPSVGGTIGNLISGFAAGHSGWQLVGDAAAGMIGGFMGGFMMEEAGMYWESAMWTIDVNIVTNCFHK